MPPRLITPEQITAAHAAGTRRIVAPRGEAVVTPAAWSRAVELGVAIDQGPSAAGPGSAAGSSPSSGPGSSPSSSAAPDPGSSERVVDPSGLLVVRGRSVRLGKFTGAGPGKNIGLTDLVTSRD